MPAEQIQAGFAFVLLTSPIRQLVEMHERKFERHEDSAESCAALPLRRTPRSVELFAALPLGRTRRSIEGKGAGLTLPQLSVNVTCEIQRAVQLYSTHDVRIFFLTPDAPHLSLLTIFSCARVVSC